MGHYNMSKRHIQKHDLWSAVVSKRHDLWSTVASKRHDLRAAVVSKRHDLRASARPQARYQKS